MVSTINSGPSAADMAQMSQKMFKSMDTDGDGKISKDEMQAVNDKMKDKTDKQGPSVDQFFSQFDTDENGSIDQSEFDNAGKQMVEKMKTMSFKMGANGTANGGFSMNDSGNSSEANSMQQLLSQLNKDSNKQLNVYSSAISTGSWQEDEDYLNAQYSTSVYA
ncbi:MAG: EF-hand domain-containing protein [Nitrospirota bacterium]